MAFCFSAVPDSCFFGFVGDAEDGTGAGTALAVAAEDGARVGWWVAAERLTRDIWQTGFALFFLSAQ